MLVKFTVLCKSLSQTWTKKFRRSFIPYSLTNYQQLLRKSLVV